MYTVVAKVAGCILDTVLYTTLLIILTNKNKITRNTHTDIFHLMACFVKISSGIDCQTGQVLVVVSVTLVI